MKLKNIHRFLLQKTIQDCRQTLRRVAKLNKRSDVKPIDVEEIRVMLALAIEAMRLANMGCDAESVKAYRRMDKYCKGWSRRMDAQEQRGNDA